MPDEVIQRARATDAAYATRLSVARNGFPLLILLRDSASQRPALPRPQMAAIRNSHFAEYLLDGKLLYQWARAMLWRDSQCAPDRVHTRGIAAPYLKPLSNDALASRSWASSRLRSADNFRRSTNSRILARQAAREAFNSNKLSKVKSDVEQ